MGDHQGHGGRGVREGQAEPSLKEQGMPCRGGQIAQVGNGGSGAEITMLLLKKAYFTSKASAQVPTETTVQRKDLLKRYHSGRERWRKEKPKLHPGFLTGGCVVDCASYRESCRM